MSQRFPEEVHAFIRENVTGRETAELAEMTNAAFGTNFTAATMKCYKANHKLRGGRGSRKGMPSKVFPREIADYIKDNYKGVGNKEMAERLNSMFGTSYTTKQLNSYYKNHGLHSGLTGHFEKGHIPANKGKRGYCAPGAEKGHFKKGHTPHNKTAIGTVLKKHDGYLWKKTGEGCREWRQLHLLIWESANGPVPEGYLVIFKDKNKENCSLDNLALVSLAENGVMNACDLRFETAEHTETGILIAKIKLASKKRRV